MPKPFYNEKKKIVSHGAFLVSSFMKGNSILVTMPGRPEVALFLTPNDIENLFMAIDEVTQ